MSEKTQLRAEILGFYRSRIAELLLILETSMKHFPEAEQKAARRYIDNTRAGMAAAENCRERMDLLED